MSEIGEAHLRQLSADLHDGPAQLVGFAALRLDSLKRIGEKRKRDAEIGDLESVLKDAVREIRAIGQGLSLPEIEHLSLAGVARHAIAAHERRTGDSVRAALALNEDDAPESVKACLYRFVQEGLNNVWRHAPGAQVGIDVGEAAGILSASIVNGAPTRVAAESAGGMGLLGLRDRVESLGGHFSFVRAADGGAILSMSIVRSGDPADA
ncbi:MAG: hypothetical protein IPL47_04615 [Phyllobacteriaceae bacterium]|nr:hypothetical protein [Phyllobacteriaceae bacterium]